MGTQLLIGICFSIDWDLRYIVLSLILALPLCQGSKRLIEQSLLASATFVIGSIWGTASLHHCTPTKEPILGSAIFKIEDLKLKKSIFHSSYLYKGQITYFQSDTGQELYQVPCHVYPPKGYERPLANSSYFIRGKIDVSADGSARLKTQGPWTKIDNTFSLAELRFKAKLGFKSFIFKKIKNKNAAEFLYALSTGELENKIMAKDFGKLGLQHILAISGFHFALVAVFCKFLLNAALSRKAALFGLMIFLTGYFIFLGSSPSVFRAWIAITLAALAELKGRKSRGLNTLGVCLIIELIWNPNVIFHIGFQFSFLCTAALLILTPKTLDWMLILFPKRTSQELSNFSILDRIAYLPCSFLRTSMAVTLSVHLASIPLCLYHFHSFPILSLFYNLFFPFFTAISLFLLLSSSLIGLICFFPANLIDSINTHLTSALLDLTEHTPRIFDYY
ncbi:MAG: ComEC/Rec2 family competence protein, partial [Chlamydiia bacterium]|nr:ComEC/Rec2 family competence protein [Chlamydiia bacterium]